VLDVTCTPAQWLLASGIFVGSLAPAGSIVRANAGDALAFHHLHLNDPRPPFLLEFYERLFDPATTARTRVGGVDALQSGPMLLLISRVSGISEHPSALWHYGWGDVSLGETYLAHAAREVTWEPPLPPDRLHLHLRSVSPSAAIAWYRDILGARVETPHEDRLTRHSDRLPLPEHRTPEALVWLGHLGLLIYRADPPLMPTRGQTADHIALSCPDFDATLSALLAAGVPLIAPAAIADGLRSAMIEGPDRLAIELVERR
jgi:catechol 2,3-dioxygenase-like lactoylglutathione lyase family enzyme